jgi:mannosylglycoprotein endo-beta-mannosidase
MLFILAMEPLQRMFAVAAEDGLLTPLPSSTVNLRVSMYADDVAVFVNPVKEEIAAVAKILEIFGIASGLVINKEKCAVFPIRCDQVELEDVMEPFQCAIQAFPCSYLGLPLHVRQLSRVQVQPLIDKVANRLPMWKGRFLNRSGRLKLINSVLSSIPTYFLTIFTLKKWAFKKMDKIRRGFLWKGSANVSGGHCLVRWSKVMRPKCMGGLGVLDLERFSRALRLRWLWYEWVEPERPWVGTEVPCSDLDRQLFRISTVVTVGNGQHASFWDAAWLDGRAPRDLAPNLYKLAWRKRNTIATDLLNLNWTRGLWRMSTAEEMAEFFVLWDLLQGVALSNAPDSIIWRWTANRSYSPKSAYRIQFQGSYSSFNAKAVWAAQAEGKHKFFMWLILQSKVLTADKLIARNWPCDPRCILCDQALETAVHLCLHCVFAREVWHLVTTWAGGFFQPPTLTDSLEGWWNASVHARPQQQKRLIAAYQMYTVWNLWKERNRRIFDGIYMTATSVFYLIKQEMQMRVIALTAPAGV